MRKIAVVDYGMGNLRSVTKALDHVGAEPRIVTGPREVETADAVVLPGVGAFADCMEALRRQDLVGALRAYVRSGRPFLGICLGLQALFEESEEAPGVRGLGIVPGRVRRFPEEPGRKVPHMGWNRIRILRDGCPLLRGVEDGSHVYFVHSYYCEPSDVSWAETLTDYGIDFVSMVWRDRTFATQFHPEKSQAVGLRMLENFVEVCG